MPARSDVRRVLLLSAPLDDERDCSQAANSTCFAPLGVVQIASALATTFPDIDVRVLDGNLCGHAAIVDYIAMFAPEVVGVSVLTPTYNSALAVARVARSLGVRHVVFGNDHASYFSEAILQRHPEVSFIVAGDDGARAFVELIRALRDGSDPHNRVPRLHMRLPNATGVVRPSAPVRDIAFQHIAPDLSLLASGAIESYLDAYERRFGYFDDIRRKPVVVNNAKGCYRASQRCCYCSIYDLTQSHGGVSEFWSVAQRHWVDYGFNLFFEVCDNFGGFRAYRRALADSVPAWWYQEARAALMVYTDAEVLVKDTCVIDDFRRLNVRRVNIGLDTSDGVMLRRMKHLHTSGVNKRAVALLKNAGIQVHCSFVLGGPGETEQSLLATSNFVEELLGEPHVITVEVSPLFPLPGAQAWHLFTGRIDSPQARALLDQCNRDIETLEPVWNQTRATFESADTVDLDLAAQLWADHFTDLGYERLLQQAHRLNASISAAGKVTGGFV